MGAGLCPHTKSIDAKDRLWFTLALSNQVAMFDRATKRFALHDLLTRGRRERLTMTLIRPMFKLMSWGLPLANWLAVDRLATGTPLPAAVQPRRLPSRPPTGAPPPACSRAQRCPMNVTIELQPVASARP
jgi:hypothetical protein